MISKDTILYRVINACLPEIKTTFSQDTMMAKYVDVVLNQFIDLRGKKKGGKHDKLGEGDMERKMMLPSYTLK